MADGFNDSNPLGTSTSFWGPNRDNDNGNNGTPVASGGSYCGGFNADEVEVFDAGQVSLESDGVHLTATYSAGVGGTNGNGNTINYVSGCLSSQPTSPVGGEVGFPITGFGYKQTTGTVLCFEIVCTLPTYTGGDMGWWASSPEGQNEQDFVEWNNYVNPGPGTASEMAWIDHTGVASPTSQGSPAYNVSAQTDGQKHTWTTLIDGNALTVITYLDGVEIGSYPWLNTWPNYYLNLILSHALRDAIAG